MPFADVLGEDEEDRDEEHRQQGRGDHAAKDGRAQGGASIDEEDTARTTAETSKATVASDKATLENAKLRLSYCFIAAPVTGIMGRWLIDQGNMVTANVDTLAVLNQIEPVRVLFTVPEKYLAEVRRRNVQGPLAVWVRVSAGSEEGGNLTFIDNTVTEATGTITLQGTFPNHDLVLWPGLGAMLPCFSGMHAVRECANGQWISPRRSPFE